MKRQIAALLSNYCLASEFVIWRDAFRWRRYDPINPYGDPVLSNHYDSMSLEQLAEEFNYEIDWERSFNHVAIVRSQA